MYWYRSVHPEYYSLYSNDFKNLAVCDWNLNRNQWSVKLPPFIPSFYYAHFDTLEEAKAYVFRKLLERREF